MAPIHRIKRLGGIEQIQNNCRIRYLVQGVIVDLTKGMECPSCGVKTNFRGGNFGGGINSTNFKCECGFSAWIVITKDDYEYEISAQPKDKGKANPYLNKGTDKKSLIIQKHYFKEAIEASDGNHSVLSALRKAVSYIDDILKEAN